MRGLIVITAIFSGVAMAGSPFLTDDPDPGVYGQHELFLFGILSDTDVVLEEPYLLAPVLGYDWTALPNFQLSIAIPYAWNTSNIHAEHGMDDIQLGFKYRFLEETETRPQLAFVPTFYLPTGREDFTNGQNWYQFPVAIQKGWGALTTYAEVGWTYNPASGQKNFPFAGWQVQYDFTPRLTLGVELYGLGATSGQGTPSGIVNAGGYYHITSHVDILFSAGHSVVGQDRTVAYLALYWTNIGGLTY